MIKLTLEKALEIGFTHGFPSYQQGGTFTPDFIEDVISDFPDEDIILCKQQTEQFKVNFDRIYSDIEERVWDDFSDQYSADLAEVFDVDHFVFEQKEKIKAIVDAINADFAKKEIYIESEYIILAQEKLPHDEI